MKLIFMFSRLAVIDGSGVLTVSPVSTGLPNEHIGSGDRGDMPTELEKFERKDVWSMAWSEVC